MCGTVPRQVRWENRFHVGVSGHNHGLHPVHRDFFSAPQPFDMLTKPRRPLAKEPIVARLTRSIATSRGTLGGAGAGASPSTSSNLPTLLTLLMSLAFGRMEICCR